MFYHIETEERTAGGRTGTLYTLRRNGGPLAEIWPAHGFNCLRRASPRHRVRTTCFTPHRLGREPGAHAQRHPDPLPVPQPHPRRQVQARPEQLSAAVERLDEAERDPRLGPRHPWRMFGYGADEDAAWIHGEFQMSVDAPEAKGFWPGDAMLSVIYRFTERSLRLESRVKNNGDGPLPFGLGFHPYFRFPCADESIDHFKLLAPARSIWTSVDNLPTGERQPVADALNWNTPRQIAGTPLDTLLHRPGGQRPTSRRPAAAGGAGHAHYPGVLQVWSSRDFRDAVLFTPPHRQAVCIEPYTCATNAVNLAERNRRRLEGPANG